MVQGLAFARTGEVKSPYRESQTLVQGRLKVRTGETRTLYRGEAGMLEGRIEGVGSLAV